jgi:hypothetical protein
MIKRMMINYRAMSERDQRLINTALGISLTVLIMSVVLLLVS